MLRRLKYSLLLNFAVPVISPILKLVGKSLHISYNNPELLEEIVHKPGAVIVAFWHCDFIALVLAVAKGGFFREKNWYVLASQSRDGELLARTVKRFGVEAVRGSSSSGGARSLLQLKEKLMKRESVAIAVDGPRGPRHIAKGGVIMLARSAGVPIYPVAFQITKKWTINSWDKTEIPLPFSAVRVNLGEPFFLPEKLSAEELEEYRQRLESELKRLKGIT